ncbi:GIY-YIG nuclease family protein [Bacillus sp. ES1-5]|uniref:GIY-YIG nuclease family protein n=1 Tax=Bacillus sp. ES1-5 TaxID=1502999 RepID=UPI0034DEEB90
MYKIFGRNQKMIYVGEVESIKTRISQHYDKDEKGRYINIITRDRNNSCCKPNMIQAIL